jgi:D-lactate dehydrogenase
VPLLEPDVMKITPEAAEPASDRAPDWVAGGTPEPLRSELTALLGEEKLLGRATDLIRYASDASPYRILPQAVVMAHNAADVAKVLEFGRHEGIPVTSVPAAPASTARDRPRASWSTCASTSPGSRCWRVG